MVAKSNTPAATAAAQLPEGWVAYLTPFSEVLGKDVNTVTELLKPVVGEPGEQAIALLKDVTASPDADIKAVLNGTPSAVANRAISLLREAQVSHAPMGFGGADILPEVPNDESWLRALRAGGELKVDQPTVISAARASLAYRVGLYDVPKLLVGKMEQFADQNSEPVGAEYYKLRKSITQQTYGEIFEAIPGLDGNFVTDKRKNELFNRIDVLLWPALVAFHNQLKGWSEAWQQGAANPAMMLNAIATLAGGGGAAMPPGMMAPPDTGAVRDQADSFNDELNKVFSGTMVPVARALAYDANRIKETLDNSSLPSLIGAGNREQMLRTLGIEVSATYPRMETNLTKYMLSVLSIKDLPAGNEELQFFSALFMLGSQIPWDQLNMKRRTLRSEG